MKIISKRNPILFLNNKFKNDASVPTNQYFIIDELTGEIWDRNPELFKTDEVLPSLIESELIFDSELNEIRLKTSIELQYDIDVTNNNSFYNKKIKLEIPDYDLLLVNGFTATAISAMDNGGIIKPPPVSYISNNKILQRKTLYLNTINSDMLVSIDGAIANNLIIRTDNKVWSQFNSTGSVELIIDEES